MSPISGDPTVTLLNTAPLLARLGVKGIATLRFVPDVLPVAIVDGSVQATGLQTLDVPFTAGETTAPAANTRLATGPPLPAGQWNITFAVAAGESNAFHIRRRNAADSADIWSQRFHTGTVANSTAQALTFVALRINVAVNEFVVIENISAGSVGVVYQASLWFQGPF